MSKVLVAVRVRPLNGRERSLGSTCVVSMSEGTRTTIQAPGTKHAAGRVFDYDHSFWSCEPGDGHFADQEEVFGSVGLPALNNAFDGYNACIFAYGQTGSGKSYSMMGPDDDKGIIPRLCEGMFARIDENTTENLTYKVEVSYMEIYNENVRDLLGDMKSKKKLKVREHKILGPYVEGLTKFAVKDYDTIASLMEEGNKSRTVASTRMNSSSSRSHAVFTIVMTQSQYDPVSEHTGEKMARVALVDLAGSERAGKTGTSGQQFKEGTNINKSLTTLGLVISALADRAGGKKKGSFVPYRDSTLTWLLKDSLGGNSKTAMIATISPSIDNIEETISTLRYADRAKKIVNDAVVNEDPNARLIRELREEVDRLQSQLGVGAGGVTNAAELEALRQQLAENQSLMQELSLSWEEKLKRAELALRERQKQLEEMGISVTSGGIAVDKSKFYLVNLNADPAMSEMLVYYLKEDETLVGSSKSAGIVLRGLGILPEHALLEIEDEDLYLTPCNDEAQVCINGKPTTTRTLIRHGYRVLWGSNYIFRINCPRAATEAPTSGTATSSIGTEWDLAQEELAINMKTDEAWEAEKRSALEEQRALFEAEISKLKNADEADRLRAMQEAERDLARMKTKLNEAAGLIREGNSLCKALCYRTEFRLGLRISIEGLLDPTLKGPSSREIAVMQQTGPIKTVASLDAFTNQVEFLKDVYDRSEENEYSVDNPPPEYYEPAKPELIGVAHVFLKDIAHGIAIDLEPGVIGRTGQIYGKLKVRWTTESYDLPDNGSPGRAGSVSGPASTASALPPGMAGFSSRQASLASMPSTSSINLARHIQITPGDVLRGHFEILEAQGLPSQLATNVYCTFTMPQASKPELVGELESDSLRAGIAGSSVHFGNRSTRFELEVNDSFLDYVENKCLPIEVWGYDTNALNRTAPEDEFDAPPSPIKEHSQQQDRIEQHKLFARRWKSRTHAVDLWMQICEVDEEGQYSPVPVITRRDVLTGGILQIRQGFARRIQLSVKQVDGAPLGMSKIVSVRFGDVWVREKASSSPGSSSEADLEIIKEQFSHILADRKAKLDDLMRDNMEKETKTDADEMRSEQLMNQWNELQAERDAMLQPEANSGLLGAIDSTPPRPGYEAQPSIVYFPMETEGMPPEAAGVSHGFEDAHAKFLNLHVISQNLDTGSGELSAVVSWDASAHDNANLLRTTRDQLRVYMRMQVAVQVQGSMQVLVLNKLVSFKVFKRNTSFKPSIRQRILGLASDLHGVGLKYKIVTSLPKFDSLNGEDADAAAEQESVRQAYDRSVDSFKNLVKMSRRRQELMFLEATSTPGRLRSPSMQRSGSFRTTDDHVGRIRQELDQARLVEDEEKVAELEERLRRLCPQEDDAIPSHETSWVLVDEPGSPTPAESPQTKIIKTLEQSCPQADASTETSLHFNVFRERLLSSPTLEKLGEISWQVSSAQSEGLLSSDQVVALKNFKAIRLRALSPTPYETQQAEESSQADAADAADPPAVEPAPAAEAAASPPPPAVQLNPGPVEPEAAEQGDAPAAQREDAVEDVLGKLPPRETPTRPKDRLVSESNSVEDFKTNEFLAIEATVREQAPATPTTSATLDPAASSRSPPPVFGGNAAEQPGRIDDDGGAEQGEEAGVEVEVEGEEAETEGEEVDEEAAAAAEEDAAVSAKESSEKPLPPLKIPMGSYVAAGSKAGYLRFYGRTKFAKGAWAGVELVAKKGKNDGSVDGVRYFECEPQHGVFVRPTKMVRLRDPNKGRRGIKT